MDLQKACAGFTKAVETILKMAVSEIGGQFSGKCRELPFCVIGNSLEFPITQKGTNVPMMRILFYL